MYNITIIDANFQATLYYLVYFFLQYSCNQNLDDELMKTQHSLHKPLRSDTRIKTLSRA